MIDRLVRENIRLCDVIEKEWQYIIKKFLQYFYLINSEV